jgi:thioredoxin reductase
VYDVIVIGAGAAGIGAALTVKSYGRSVLVLEAQNSRTTSTIRPADS